MTLTVELPENAGAALASEARRRGVTPEQAAADDLQQKYAAEVVSRSANRHERVEQLLQWARTLPAGLPLSDEAISREAIYAREDDVNYGIREPHA